VACVATREAWCAQKSSIVSATVTVGRVDVVCDHHTTDDMKKREAGRGKTRRKTRRRDLLVMMTFQTAAYSTHTCRSTSPIGLQ